MQIIFENNRIFEPTCATIGVFDGVHLGHRFLLENLKKEAILSGLKPLVVTFKNHPQHFFEPQNKFQLLTIEEEKIGLISALNPDFLLLLDFNKEIAAMKAVDFLLFLKNNYCLKKLIIGYNHSFGSDKIKDFEQYKQIGKSLEIEFKQCPAAPPTVVGELNNTLKISSSNIRKLLCEGDIENANVMLGRDYAVSGVVVDGEKNGQKIGFPTANLSVPPHKLIPKSGVYAVKILIANQTFNGMLYIGNRPTLHGKTQTVEVNIFDFNENIYGRQITVFLKYFVREDQKFNSLTELKAQLTKDKTEILGLL